MNLKQLIIALWFLSPLRDIIVYKIKSIIAEHKSYKETILNDHAVMYKEVKKD